MTFCRQPFRLPFSGPAKPTRLFLIRQCLLVNFSQNNHQWPPGGVEGVASVSENLFFHATPCRKTRAAYPPCDRSTSCFWGACSFSRFSFLISVRRPYNFSWITYMVDWFCFAPVLRTGLYHLVKISPPPHPLGTPGCHWIVSLLRTVPRSRVNTPPTESRHACSQATACSFPSPSCMQTVRT